MARPKAETALSEGQVMALLRERFAAPEYAFMPHVRNGTGFVRRTTRTADALAMSLWPSRGLELHGIEIKSSRADWIHEKDQPEKAEEIARFCDRWWLVIGHSAIVQPGELPPTWGLIAPGPRKKLVVVKEAPKLEAQPLDRAQLAAILRRASECVVPTAELDERMKLKIQQAQENAERDVEQRIASATRGLQSAVTRMEERITRFETLSGLDLDHWQLGDIAAAVRFISEGGVKNIRGDLERWRERARQIAGDLDAVLEAEPATPKTGTEG